MAIEIGGKRTDAKRETDGVWVSFADSPTGYIWWMDGETRPVGDDVEVGRLKVARSGNARAREFSKRAMKPHKRLMQQLGEVPEKIAMDVLVQTLAHAILTDWEGINVGGEAVPFSVEAATQALEDEDFRDLVLNVSSTAQVYRDTVIAEDSKSLGN